MPRTLLLLAAALLATGLAALLVARASGAGARAGGDRPITCRETIPSPEGPVLWMGEACMVARAGQGSLPVDCLRTVGDRRGYDPACMSGAGWRVLGDD